jgi:hypothetical protein
MQKSSDGSNNFDAAREGSPRATPPVGDADGVQKTSYVTGRGTDPNAASEGPAATGGAGRGRNPLLWVAILIALALAAIYVIGLFG